MRLHYLTEMATRFHSKLSKKKVLVSNFETICVPCFFFAFGFSFSGGNYEMFRQNHIMTVKRKEETKVIINNMVIIARSGCAKFLILIT